MGVRNCCRNGCDDIMCSTYIEDIGYMCRECKSELIKYFEDKGLEELPENELYKEIEDFMNTKVGTYVKKKKINIDAFLDNCDLY